MGRGRGALNCLANVVRVLACILQFAIEKAVKQMMSQSMMVICIQSGKNTQIAFDMS